MLRAVTGELAQQFVDVDYFPSYEIIASHFSRGFFFDSNLRTVHAAGVENVMRIFFGAHGSSPNKAAARPKRPKQTAAAANEDEVVCEEILMEAFNSHA